MSDTELIWWLEDNKATIRPSDLIADRWWCCRPGKNPVISKTWRGAVKKAIAMSKKK